MFMRNFFIKEIWKKEKIEQTFATTLSKFDLTIIENYYPVVFVVFSNVLLQSYSLLKKEIFVKQCICFIFVDKKNAKSIH